MKRTIDLTSFSDEVSIKTSTGEEFIIPSDVSVEMMQKLSELQDKIKKVQTPIEQLPVVQQLVYLIVSIEGDNNITFEEFKKIKDFTYVKRLEKVVEIFWQNINGELEKVIPSDPNTESPEV